MRIPPPHVGTCTFYYMVVTAAADEACDWLFTVSSATMRRSGMAQLKPMPARLQVPAGCIHI